MNHLFVISFGCIILISAQRKTGRNCEAELDKCSMEKSLITCQRGLGECIRSQHHRSDDMIPKSKNGFMEKFKCCYHALSVCIDEDSELQQCSEAMLKCAVGKKTIAQFRRESPKKLREMFGRYGVCIRTGCINDCVYEYYNDMEHLLGMDCLNKYIHCTFSSDEEKRSSCHNEWKACMIPPCKDTVKQTFKTKLIVGIWACQKYPLGGRKEGTHVLNTLKCILELYRNGIPMSHMLSVEHVRESCYLVYGQNNNTLKEQYERCVKNNAKAIDVSLGRTKNIRSQLSLCVQ